MLIINWIICIVFLNFVSIINGNNIILRLSIKENIDTNQNPIGNMRELIKNQTNLDKSTVFKSFKLDRAKSSAYRDVNYIKIMKSTGEIWLQSSIDRESICQRLRNCEKDVTKLVYLVFADSQVFELVIEIKDINDNYPVFKLKDNVIRIQENIQIGQKYSLPIATDKDSKELGVKKYELKEKTNSLYKKYFKLELDKYRKPYLVIIKNIDREETPKFEFIMQVIDGGNQHTTCNIIIEITDINDNTPQWVGLPYHKDIRECTTQDLVMRLQAEDKDDSSTEGGRISYRISENTENYEWITKTFFITSDRLLLNNGALKVFGRSNAKITVIASDGGGRMNETVVDINIIDCNDHAPQIELKEVVWKVTENQKTRQKIRQINVEDKDKGQNSKFNCYINDTMYMRLKETYSSTDDQGFHFKSYILETKPDVSFDREKMTRYNVELICKDEGSPVMTSSVVITVYIEDANDNPPVFQGNKVKTFHVSEAVQHGVVIGHVTATDKDDNPNNIIFYRIEGDKVADDTFQINRNGEIQIKNSLDREKINSYKFIVMAMDSKKTPALNDTCEVRVIVTDVNDCAPQIQSIYEFNITESYGKRPIHVNLGKLNSTDKDAGLNSHVYFRIKKRTRLPHFNRRFNPRMNRFIRITEEGILSVYGIIDREKTESMQETVEVIDRGNPPLTAETTIIINVLDLNDNAPVFHKVSKGVIRGNITLSTTPGGIIMILQATDPDLAENGTVKFSLAKDSINRPKSFELFTVQEDGHVLLSGDPAAKLQMKELIRSQRNNKFQIIVKARDCGNPPKNTTQMIFIMYVDSGNRNRGDIGGNGAGDRNRSNYGGAGNNASNRGRNKKNRYSDKEGNSLNGRSNQKGRGGYPGNGNRRSSFNTESRYLMILLVCVVSLVLIVFGIALFCFLKQNCLRRPESHVHKQTQNRASGINTAMNSQAYHKAQKLNKDKSSGSVTIMEASPNNSNQIDSLNNSYILEGAAFHLQDPRGNTANYTNLTRFKNEIYSPIQPHQFGYNQAPSSPLLSHHTMNIPHSSSNVSYTPFQQHQPQPPMSSCSKKPQHHNYELEDTSSLMMDQQKWIHNQQNDPFINDDHNSKSLMPLNNPNNNNNNESNFHNKTFTPGLERRNNPNNCSTSSHLDSNPNIIKSDSASNIKFNFVTSSFV